jgi:C4-dicarboxylate transporter DctQ subunit
MNMSDNVGTRKMEINIILKFLQKMIDLHQWITDICVLLAGILLVFMLIIVNMEVVLRYLIGRPTDWVVETTEFCLFYLPFLAATWVLRKEGHVKVDLMLNRLRPEWQPLFTALTSLMCVIVCLFISWYGAKLTWYFFQVDYRTPGVLRVPKFIIIIVIPVGTFLFAIQFLRRTYNHWQIWRTMAREKRRLKKTPD